MAFMNQEHKKELSPAIKAVLKKYGMKGSISVKHHSTLVVTITEGPLDLIGAANDFNRKFAEQRGQQFYPVEDCYQEHGYRIDEHYEGEIRDFFAELHAAMNTGNFDNSDPMTDYFHVGWYTNINVGRSRAKPYKLTA